MKYLIELAGKRAHFIKGTKRGSSAVMTAIIFLGFSICIAGAIGVSRRLVVSSGCEAFGRLWAKSVLSEYDVHLHDDYAIMAYFGNDEDVTEKLNAYLKYSLRNKLGSSIKGANADLTGYELGDPGNFREALKLGFTGSAISELINGRGRSYRGLDEKNGYEEEGRLICNSVVLDTLPSRGMSGGVSGEDLAEKAEKAGNENGILNMMRNAGADVLLMERCFDNHVTSADDKKHLFVNEWEYVINGSMDDEKNYRSCRNRLFIARNILNLLSLYRDPAKVEIITSIAETITPGPLGLATQAVIAEVWAALETEADLDELYHDRRVPAVKTADQWKISPSELLNSKEIRKELDDESKRLLDENREELSGITDGVHAAVNFTEGLDYDEYMMIMILSMNENVRLLRIMDLVQINMKYRYYRDFNLMEYYTGTRFTLEVNGKSHEFEDAYK